MKIFNNKMIFKLGLKAFILLILMISYLGCSDNKTNPVISASNNNLNLSSIGKNSSGANMQSLLVIDSVKLMVKDLKLYSEDQNGNDEDETVFSTGPFIIKIDPNVKQLNFVTGAILPPGTFNKVKFDIHKLGENEIPPDPDFLDSHGRYSVIVKGNFSDMPFVYKSRISANQKLHFQKPLVIIQEKSTNNLTIEVNPYIWFTGDNGSILDPNNPANRPFIDDNIRDNIRRPFMRIFVDYDLDGNPDP